MSCPDWKTLAAWRDDPRAEEPAEWRDALAHLDQGCAQCRRAACAADPTLVFRRLRAVPAPSPAQEASEVEAMRRAVAAMQAASRVQASERSGRSARTLRMMSWKRWGVAAALALAALSLPAGPSSRRDTAAPRSLPAAMPAAFTESSAMALAGQAAPGALGDDLPTLEGVDNRPDARVYHMGGEELAVTMIFDETLDV